MGSPVILSLFSVYSGNEVIHTICTYCPQSAFYWLICALIRFVIYTICTDRLLYWVPSLLGNRNVAIEMSAFHCNAIFVSSYSMDAIRAVTKLVSVPDAISVATGPDTIP